MNLIVLGSIAASAVLVFILWRLVRKNSHRPSLPTTAAWIDELSIERYRPMMRLLNTRDIEFLRSQPGFSAGMIRTLRAERARLFRTHLNCLRADFQRVCTALKLVMLHSTFDRPDLAAAVLRQEMLFAVAMYQVQIRLLLYRAGIGGVDATELVRIFEGLRLELRSLVPSVADMTA
jgi:hypothetical protein